MKLIVFAAAVGSVVALVGFAGAANASATIDLLWADTGTPEISGVDLSSPITLQVILTAGPNGSNGGSVSVDYSAALGVLSVLEFASTPGGVLPAVFGTTNDTGSRVETINAFRFSPFFPYLEEGQSHQLGTVTFHKSGLLNGVFEIRSDADGPTDGIVDPGNIDITATSTFKSAFLIQGDPAFCGFVIEINTLRAGSPTVTVGSTKDVTAKARIAKGTAVSGTTIDTTLRITAIDGSDFVDSQRSGPIQLGVGKGGKGDKLTMNISQCDSGSIDFVATFFGTDVNGNLCSATRRTARTCN